MNTKLFPSACALPCALASLVSCDPAEPASEAASTGIDSEMVSRTEDSGRTPVGTTELSSYRPLKIDDVNPDALVGLEPLFVEPEVSDQAPDLSTWADGWSDEDEEAAAAAYEADQTWYSESGERYEAILVLEDGAAWGRLGSSGDWPLPTEENGFGSQLPHDSLIPTFSSGQDVEPDAVDHTPGRSLGAQPDPMLAVCRSIGCDGRSRLSNPWYWPEIIIGSLDQTSNAPATGNNCTGAKVGPRAVLTASHCVLSEQGTWTTSGWFHPGQYGSNEQAGINGTAVRWSGVYARDYRGGRQYDYAVVFLEDREDVVDLGWFGINWWNSAGSYDGKSIYVSGYPGFYEPCAASSYPYNYCGGFQYRDNDTLSSSDYGTSYPFAYQLGHEVMTQQGQSGAPMYRSTAAEAILGVHWGWRESSPAKNWGARFRSSMYNDVCAWIAAVGSLHGTHANCN